MVYQEHNQVVLGIRPTLFIGIGGTGDLIVRRLKRLFRENYGESIPAFRYLVIDMSDLADHEGLEPLEPSEKCALNTFDSYDVVQNIDKFKSIKDFWPDDPRNPGKPLNPKNLGLGTGVGQDRLTGRMAFFYYYNDNPKGGKSIKGALQQALSGITQANLVNANGALTGGMRWEVIGNGAVQVIMIFSICGGTGGGMFLDTAYACRQLLGNARGHYIDAYCIMPSVYEQKIENITPAERDNLYANACASIMDIEALNLDTDWKADYAGQAAVAGVPPFNRQYMFEYTQSQGVDPGSPDNMFDNMAQSIFLSIGTSIYQNLDVIRGNEEDAMYQVRRGEKQRLFGSFGSASVIYPRNEMMEYCCSMLSKEFIQGRIIPDITVFTSEQKNALEQSGKNQAGTFLQAQKISASQLISELLRSCDYDVIDSAKLIDEAKDKQGHKAAMAALTLLKDRDSAIRINQNNIIKNRSVELRGEVVDSAQRKTLDIVKSYGLHEAKEFLNSLLRKLPESPHGIICSIPDSRDYIQAETRKRESKFYEQEKRREQALKDLGSRLLSTVLATPQQRQVVVSKAIDKFKEYYKAASEWDANDIGISFYTALSEDIKNNVLAPLSKIEAIIAVAEKLLVEKSANAQKKCRLNPANPFSRSCVTTDFVEEEYNRTRPNIRDLNTLFWEQLENVSWTGLSERLTSKELADRFVKAASLRFNFIAERTVTDVIAATAGPNLGPTALAREFTALQLICFPYLRFNEGGVGQNPPRRNSYIGIADPISWEKLLEAIGPDRAKGYQEAVVGLSHRMDLFQRMNCIASNNFNSWGFLENCYQQAITDGKIIRLVRAESAEATRDNESIFALSVAYSLISRKGDSYFWNPTKLPVPPKNGNLGKGRVEAMADFARKHQNWVDNGAELIDKAIESDGADKTIEFLDSWADHLKKEMIPAGEKLKQQYQKELEYINIKRDEINEKKRTRD